MTSSAIANKEQLKVLRGIIDVDSLLDTTFLITISPASEEDAVEFEFRSLKGIAGKPLELDNVRAERLQL